jgi:chitodextrinase
MKADTNPMAGTLKITDNVKLVLRGPDGVVKDVRIANTVTTAGKNGAADQVLAAPTLAKPTHVAVGTGTPSGTALGVELDRNSNTSKTRSGAVVTIVADWAAGDATGALTEAGTFDAGAAGNMWMSASFSVINKGASDTLQITWTLTFA